MHRHNENHAYFQLNKKTKLTQNYVQLCKRKIYVLSILTERSKETDKDQLFLLQQFYHQLVHHTVQVVVNFLHGIYFELVLNSLLDDYCRGNKPVISTITFLYQGQILRLTFIHVHMVNYFYNHIDFEPNIGDLPVEVAFAVTDQTLKHNF